MPHRFRRLIWFRSCRRAVEHDRVPEPVVPAMSISLCHARRDGSGALLVRHRHRMKSLWEGLSRLNGDTTPRKKSGVLSPLTSINTCTYCSLLLPLYALSIVVPPTREGSWIKISPGCPVKSL